MSLQNPIGNKFFRGKDRNNTLYFQIIMVAKKSVLQIRGILYRHCKARLKNKNE